MLIKKGIQVKIITGKDKGKTGEITRLLDDQRVYVSGINMIKRHTKGNPQAGQPGGIIEKEAPIHISNLSLLTSDGKTTRVGYRTEDDTKVRFSKKTDEVI